MIDKRKGETKKPQPSEPSIFPKADKMPESRQEIPSQKIAPKGPKTGA